MKSSRIGVSVAALAALAFALAPRGMEAQLTSPVMAGTPVSPRVFLDCQGQVLCDRTHFRTEIQWVNWANDREDADVHVILTSEPVGGGGRRTTLDFAGRGDLEWLTDQLTYTSSGTDVQIETLDGMTQALRLGLVRFAVELGLGRDIEVAMNRPVSFADASIDGSGAAVSAAQEPYDPWNYWTFTAGLSGNFNIQEFQRSYQFNPSFSTNRVTEGWKFDLSTRYNYNRQRRQLSSGTREDNRDSWNVGSTVVRSVTQHVSMGLDLGGASSVQNNRDARVTVAPAVEWNYYPYLEANRRQFIAFYSAGLQYNNYEEITILGKLEETVPLHRFQIQYRAVEGWGNAGLSFDASQYLHGQDLYSFGASGNISFRVARGFEISLSASGEKIQDQIDTAADLSDDDILAGVQSLPSGYQYQASIGFNYRFGSSFSNIVNTRMPTISGGAGGRGGGGGNPGGGRGGF